VPPGAALVAGIAFALIFGNPFPAQTRKASQRLLQISVIGLGAGMDLAVVGRVGLHGLGYTAIGIGAAATIGFALTKALHVRRDSAILVTCGTAICGGSAIAAVAPAIGARDEDTSVALAVVFLLNAIALFAFPPIGHAVGLSQESFGLWAALAIHDTSSVVGAAAHYGERALEIATAAKLARALWIVPVTAIVGYVVHRHDADGTARVKPKRPWFIAGFVAAAALVTFVPQLRPAGDIVSFGAHRLLAATLFLIGLGLTRAAIKALGVRPLALAVGLWIALGSGTLLAISRGWIG
jgi:uncharacterized integral membrane protein (TIGR00698 family)